MTIGGETRTPDFSFRERLEKRLYCCLNNELCPPENIVVLGYLLRRDVSLLIPKIRPKQDLASVGRKKEAHKGTKQTFPQAKAMYMTYEKSKGLILTLEIKASSGLERFWKRVK